MNKREKTLLKRIHKEENIIIYGAGQVGRLFVQWLLKNKIEAKKIIIAVTQLNGNPAVINGVRVQDIESVKKTVNNSTMVIIATFASFHSEIEKKLNEQGFFNVIKMEDEFYRSLNCNATILQKLRNKKVVVYEKIIGKIFCNRKLKDYILFESHDDYDGNSGALCNKILNNGTAKKYKMIWLVQDPGKFKDKRNRYLRFQSISKDRGFWDIYYRYRAKFIFYDNRPIRKKRPDQTSVYLTHGTNPLKYVKGIINLPEETDYVLVTSKEMIELGLDQYGLSREKYFVCGQPRSDHFYDRADDIKKLPLKTEYAKKIIWMPTFRQHCRTTRSDTTREFAFGIPVVETVEQLKQLDEFLKEKNILLIIKPHPIQNLSYIKVQNSSNILVLTNERMKELHIDLYGLLAGTDALISDYSNVTFDYLLGDNPIGYARNDETDYKLAFVDNFEEYMMGPVLRTVDDIIGFIGDVIDGKDSYKEQRKAVREKVHLYCDNKNSERIIDFFDL